MGTDYAEMERSFVAALKDDTGRDLDDWLAAISASGHAERNDIIDWLRLQGFAFPKASWLERIHHNGGQLIYADDAPANDTATEPKARASAKGRSTKTAPPRRATSQADGKSGSAETTLSAEKTQPHAKRLSVADPVVGSGGTPPVAAPPVRGFKPVLVSVTNAGLYDAAITELITQAKGLRPLCERLLQDLSKAVPDVILKAHSPLITASRNGRTFLAIWPHAKSLRVYVDADATLSPRLRRSDGGLKADAPFSHVLMLDDARQLDNELSTLFQRIAG